MYSRSQKTNKQLLVFCVFDFYAIQWGKKGTKIMKFETEEKLLFFAEWGMVVLIFVAMGVGLYFLLR